MPRKKKTNPIEESDILSNYPPDATPEAQENRMIALAMELAEKQLREGTASSQVIAHFLKLGSSQGRLEKEMLEKQKELADAKADTLKSAKRVEELYANALEAMKRYSGNDESA